MPLPEITDRAPTPLERAAAGELLDRHELAAIFGLSQSGYYKRAKQGDFDRFRLHPAIGPRCYSGVLVYRYLQGEAVYVPTFGRKRIAR